MKTLTHIPEEAIDELYIRELTSVTTANISKALIEAFIADSYFYLVLSENEGQKKRMLEAFDEKIEALLAALMDKGYASWILTNIEESFKKQLRTTNQRSFLRWNPRYLAIAPKNINKIVL